MPRLLDAAELDRQLLDLPGAQRDRAGALAVAVRAPTFAAAVRLVGLVADEAEAMDHHPDVDLRWRTATFTLSTHSAGGVTQLDVELAHRVLELAREVGAVVLPPPERVEIALDVVDAAAVRPFWAAGLGYAQFPTESGGMELQDPGGRGPVLWFQQMNPPRTGRGRFHLDVYVADVPAALHRVESCLAAGGRLVTQEHVPSWWVLADPEGNELCICTREADPEPDAAG